MADSSNQPVPPHSPRLIPRHATQMLAAELSPERKTAVKVPRHAAQVLPDLLLHAKEELHESSSPSTETNFLNFEKHLIANHIGSLGDCMIYKKETHHAEATAVEEEEATHPQTTPQTETRPKVSKASMDSGSGSFDMAAECFYVDH